MWRAVLLAAVFGGVFTLGVDRLLDTETRSTAGPTGAVVVSEGSEMAMLPIADPGPARALVSQVLPTLGVSGVAVEYGVYPLRGAGRGPEATLPLVSFTCPVDRPCGTIFRTLRQLAAAKGMSLIGHQGREQAARALYRALLDKGHPALALRAYPAGPRLSVVLTGVGQDAALVEPLLGLDADVTFAVQADARDASRVARRLTDAGREIIAHLPMEPIDPSTGSQRRHLATSMSVEAIERETADYLDRVPGAVGADNHRGGRLTTSRTHMQAVLSVLAQRGVFFFDGLTSDASVGAATSHANGVRVTARSHRLTGDAVSIDAQLKSVEVALALEGHAVIVAEASTTVLGVLPRWLQALRSRRVSLLRLSEIVL